MTQQPRSALSNLNVILPILFALVVVLTGVFASGTATTIVSVAGAVLLGLFYATRSRFPGR